MSGGRASEHRNSRPSLDTLTTEVNYLLGKSMAEKTWKTYKTAIESFRSFRIFYNLPYIWPAPLYDILYYIAHLSSSGLSASTVSTYISGLSHTHKLHALTDNTKSFLVSKMIEGLKRLKNPKTDARLPISLDLLKRLIHALPFVCSSTYESTMFGSAFSLCFFALLRVGEITCDSKNRTGKHVIQTSDILFSKTENSEELGIRICTSKTDQYGVGVTLKICRQSDHLICPIALLKRYLAVKTKTHSTESNIYTHFNGSSLTRYQFSSLLQKALSFCEESGHFRPHSFRIGGASEAKRHGIDDDTIKRWGRWVSDAYLKYIRISP